MTPKNLQDDNSSVNLEDLANEESVHDEYDVDNKEKAESQEDQKKLDEFQLASLFSDKVLFYIIKKLRDGPIETNAFYKLLKTKFRKLPKPVKDYFKILYDYDFIRIYSFTKTKPDPDRTPNLFPHMQVGETKEFYILVKDFYAIRKPPINVLDELDRSDLPINEIRILRKEIEDFFNHYTNQRLNGDDQDVLALFNDQKLLAAITYLTNKIYKIQELSDEMKGHWTKEPMKVFRTLEQKNFIKILKHKKKNEQWVVLKTAIELKPIFPEYQLKAINQKIAENKWSKEFAILTLNYLKYYYMKLEKPEFLERILIRVENIRQKLKPFIEKLESIEIKLKDNPNQNISEKELKDVSEKKINKFYSQLQELYKKMGDVDGISMISKEWEEIQQRIQKIKDNS